MKSLKITKSSHSTLLRGLKHASLYWGQSPYVYSGLAEEYLYNELLCGM